MTHVERALDLATSVEAPPAKALDLGTGGGVPGLPLALLWKQTEWTLVEGGATRAAFLEEVVGELGLAGRVSVLPERAEVAGRSMLRGGVDLVVARGFAGPAVTAECSAPFLRPGGRLVVAEPPGGEPGRWSEDGLALLGMQRGRAESAPTAYQVIEQSSLCPERFPRRVGIPAKRPLF